MKWYAIVNSIHYIIYHIIIRLNTIISPLNQQITRAPSKKLYWVKPFHFCPGPSSFQRHWHLSRAHCAAMHRGESIASAAPHEAGVVSKAHGEANHDRSTCLPGAEICRCFCTPGCRYWYEWYICMIWMFDMNDYECINTLHIFGCMQW